MVTSPLPCPRTLQSAQQLELQTSNIHEHGALFPQVTPGEKKIFSPLSLSFVTFTHQTMYSPSLSLSGNYCMLNIFRGLLCWFTTRSLQRCRGGKPHHRTLLDFNDRQPAFGTSITVVLAVSKDWRDNCLERNYRDIF
jgi:hypothetical protein